MATIEFQSPTDDENVPLNTGCEAPATEYVDVTVDKPFMLTLNTLDLVPNVLEMLRLKS